MYRKNQHSRFNLIFSYNIKISNSAKDNMWGFLERLDNCSNNKVKKTLLTEDEKKYTGHSEFSLEQLTETAEDIFLPSKNTFFNLQSCHL